MDIQRSINLILAIDASQIPAIIAMIVLVFCSAFFSMSETVFSTVNTVRLKIQVEEGKKGAKLALRCTENFNNTLTTLLIGNNIVNIALATISVGFWVKVITSSPSLAEVVSTAVTTVVVLICGEILPKTIAKANADRLAPVLGRVIYVIYLILFPLVFIFKGLQKGIQKKESSEPKMNEAELEVILDTMEEEGSIESEEVELIQNILELNDRTTKDIMTPRVDMLMLDYSMSIESIKNKLFECQFSRVPIYNEDKDAIIGILYEREFLTKYILEQEFDLKDILRPVKYVSSTMKVNSLIHYLKKEKMHIAIVSGEYGETAGLVTMEDALEELVGEIYDEHDSYEDDVLIKKIAERKYNVQAQIYLEDLFDELKLGKIPETEASKLSGWLYSQLESIPQNHQKVEYVTKFIKKDEEDTEYVDVAYKLVFTITKVEDRRIIEVNLEIFDYIEDEDED